jgi:opacity protein-like surface antigen
MRRLLLATAMAVTATGAHAADMPDFLRGTLPATSAPTRNWDGWYVGGQAGYSSTSNDMSQSVVGLTDSIFRGTNFQQPASQMPLLGKATAQGTGFGAFVGRNYQWDDIVLGVEANYNYVNLSAMSAAGIGPIQLGTLPGDNPPPGISYENHLQLTGNATVKIRDAITFRGRAGWASGDFLPYAFGGLAVGRIDVNRTVTSAAGREEYAAIGGTSVYVGDYSFPQISTTVTQGRTNNFVAGWTAGLGMEYMLWGNLFVRGEWEYIRFMSIENTVVTMNSVHAGIGYKF